METFKSEYKKEYYKNNKQKIIFKRSVKFRCFCDGIYLCNNKIRHENSKKHQKYITDKFNTENGKIYILNPIEEIF